MADVREDFITNMVREQEESMKETVELPLFVDKWLSNGLNATKAYQEIRPNVTEGSARTLGSRMLAKVDKTVLCDAYGLSIEAIFTQIRKGMEAEMTTSTGDVVPNWPVRTHFIDIAAKIRGLYK